MGVSNIVYFAIDSIPPKIVLLTPQNASYGSTDIALTFTNNKPTSWLAYNLDGQGNITIIGNVTLPALTNGSHTLTIYATDSVGNIGSETIDFNIAPFPFVTVAAVASVIIIAFAVGYIFYRNKKSAKNKDQKIQKPIEPEKKTS